MRKPNIGQLVWSHGRFGGFTVVRIDTAQGVANIQAAKRAGIIEKNVPFSAIHPLDLEDFSQVAVRIVRNA